MQSGMAFLVIIYAIAISRCSFMVMAQKMMRLKMKGVGHTIQILADTSLHIDDFLEIHGLLPRDGGLRYTLDKDDNVIRDCSLSEVPDTLFLGLPDTVLSVWVEQTTRYGVQTKTVLENGDELYVPGLKPNEHCHVFVSRKSNTDNGVIRQHGYRFRTDEQPYLNGDHVYVKAPLFGNHVNIFEPITGTESKELIFNPGNTSMNDIRGLWCVCTYHPEVEAGGSLLYQPELTFVPPGFMPFSAQKKPTKFSPKKKHKNIGLSVFKVKNRDLPWGSGLVQGVWRYGIAFIAGYTKGNRVIGRKVKTIKNADGRNVNLVNSFREQGAPLRRGDTLHIRVPKSGDSTSIFNAHTGENNLDVRIHTPNGQSFAPFRDKWVIARVCKKQKQEGILQVMIVPELSSAHEVKFKFD